MRLAIVGGGAAGLTASYYLAPDHEIVLFEKQDRLGGNVRTIGLNEPLPVDAKKAPVLDNGVIEFMANNSPCLLTLLGELDVETEMIIGGSTSYFLEDGTSFHMPSAISRNKNQRDLAPLYADLAGNIITFLPSLARLLRGRGSQPLGSVLGQDTLSRWTRGLMMYAYSMPYPLIDQMPLELARETLNRVVRDRRWLRIPGGVYTYMQHILDRVELEVRTSVKHLKVTRKAGSVQIETESASETFDMIILAVPPSEVTSILADATDTENELFTGWQTNMAETVIHTDESLYEESSAPEYTEFDIFELSGGKDAGYNAYLNRLAGLPTENGDQFFLAFNLLERIDSNKIVHRTTHQTTAFRAKKYNREEIRKASGTNCILFAGAYLYDGLHEGAVRSAMAVKQTLEQMNR